MNDRSRNSRTSARPLRYLWTFLALPPLALLSMGASTCGSNTQMVPMRDGVSLATDVYTPKGGTTSPGLVIRTPYGRAGLQTGAMSYANAGYAVSVQDMRGFGDSEGQFMMFTDDGWGARQDGYDTVEWAATQSWANGSACLWGASALAITSLLGAASNPPHLKCVYEVVGSGDLYHQVAFWGGDLREEMVVNWLNGLAQPDALQAIYDHPTDDAFWDPVSMQDRWANVQVPIYSTGGWYDIFLQGNLDTFTGVNTNGGPGGKGTQKLVMGPWSHGSTGPIVGELTYPENSVMPGGEDLRWLEHWLKGVANGIDTEPKVKYYLMGDVDTASDEWNIWKTSEVWPVASVSTPLYLRTGGLLAFNAPAETASSQHYAFDPENPVPTVGGNNLTLAAGPYDQRSVESRADVLIFSTDILTQPVAITGRVTAKLWVSSSALDTDFTVKLTDVYPDGRSMLVSDGVKRMRFRDGFNTEKLMTPGQVYPVEIDLWSTALVFNKGHQIRVAVSSSNSPRFGLNPNTGDTLYVDGGSSIVADQTLYHDAAHPSQLVLPVVGL